jgi:hypothetical protein
VQFFYLEPMQTCLPMATLGPLKPRLYADMLEDGADRRMHMPVTRCRIPIRIEHRRCLVDRRLIDRAEQRIAEMMT